LAFGGLELSGTSAHLHLLLSQPGSDLKKKPVSENKPRKPIEKSTKKPTEGPQKNKEGVLKKMLIWCKKE